MTWRLTPVFLLIPLLALPSHVFAQPGPPDHWELRQNEPNPFCPDYDGVTQVSVVAPSAARLELVVLSPDSASVIRLLADTEIPGAGFFSVWWNGADEDDQTVPSGLYPYRLTATDRDSGDLLFLDVKIASVTCVTATEPRTWGRVKALYR